MSLRLVQAHSPRYSLTGNLAAALASQWDLSTWEDALIDYFTDWLEKNPAQTLVEESAEVLIHVIKRAGEKKRWQNVIRMGRKLESGLALWKRWQAWADILELILKAAKAMGDKKAEAWVLHQLGSRAMCLDFIDQARELLNQAANIRRAIGDQAGFELTQHNLNVLGKPLVPSKIQQKAGCRRYCVFSGIGIGVVILLGMAAIIFIVAKTLNFFGPDDKTVHNTDIPQMTSIPSMPTSTPKPQESLLPPATETYTVTPSFTPTPTDTLTYTPTPTPTFTPTLTSTPSFTPTLTSTKTPSPTNTFNAPPSVPVVIYPKPYDTVFCDGSSVALDWDVPYDAGGIAEYQVWLQVNQNGQWLDVFREEFMTNSWLDITEVVKKYCGYSLSGSVRAKDNEGVWGGWSPWTDFYTKVPNIPPEKPVIIFPKQNDTVVCDGTSVVLDWNTPYDAGGVIEYQVGLQINQNGQWTDISGGGNTTISQFDITEVVKKYCGYTMSGHVRAKDNEGMWGEWSSWRDFYTKIPNTPPPAPKIKYPLNGEKVNCTATVALQWLEPYDSSGIDSYGLKLEVYDNTKKQWSRIITKEKYASTKLDITPFMPYSCGLDLRWSVQAVDKEGAIGPWSPWAVFYPIQIID
jgi:hypothetical protein